MSLLKRLLCLLSIASCRGISLRLHTFVDDHMVLQREPFQAKIWGWASPFVNITTKIDGSFVSFAVADATGSWTIELPPHPASAGHRLTITDGKSVAVVDDIAFGDVFLCSGQSNMQMSVQGAMNATTEIEDSIHYRNLRLATVRLTTSGSPQSEVPSGATNYTWARSGPDAFGEGTFSYYSATCYFFGRDLYKQLGGTVPIGLVTSCWGGQQVEAFSSVDALNDDTCGGTVDSSDPPKKTDDFNDKHIPFLERKPMDDVLDGEISFGVPPISLWNAMIHPLLSMRFSGAVWYQGESNADNATSYACRFPAMIADWRRKFELPDLYFYYVELAGFKQGGTWPSVRAAQRAALKLDKVGLATAIDLADHSSPSGGIHPRRKQEVGRRLSLRALSMQYHKNLSSQGPQLEFFQQDTKGGKVLLKFSSETSTTLHLHGSADSSLTCSTSPFEIMDAIGNWTRVARVRVQRPMQVILEGIPTDTTVVGIRYAWEPYPECILYNGLGGPDGHLGLPATPFEACLYPSNEGSWTGRRCRTSPAKMLMTSS